MPERSNPFQCDAVGCDALRRLVNHWYVVLTDDTGIHIYEWDKAPKKAMDEGHHFCGIAHTTSFVSKMLSPDRPHDPERESTLELKPPLTREGKETEQ
jgi:hypothetical protein